MSALTSQDLSDLIGRIYDCTLDPGLWDDVLVELGMRFGCFSAAQLSLVDRKHGHFLISRWPGDNAKHIEALHRHFSEIDSHIASVLDNGLSLDEPMIISRHISAATRASSPYFQEAIPMGMNDIAHFNLMHSPTRAAGLGLMRLENVDVFTDHEVEMLRLLVPHVRRAITISNVLDAKTIEADRLSETLDTLKQGVVLADAQAGILHANRSAEAMMRDSGVLHSTNGVLHAARPAAGAELRDAVSVAARNEAGIGKSGISIRLSDDFEKPVVAHVLPLTAGELRTRIEPEAVAAVFINSPMDEACCAQSLVKTYGLTPAEARVLVPILEGKTVAEAARDAAIATTTSRTHLNSIFVKTGVSRQSELIKLAAAVGSPVRNS